MTSAGASRTRARAAGRGKIGPSISPASIDGDSVDRFVPPAPRGRRRRSGRLHNANDPPPQSLLSLTSVAHSLPDLCESVTVRSAAHTHVPEYLGRGKLKFFRSR